MHTRFAVLLVLLLSVSTATADNSQGDAAISGFPCPDLPLSNGSPATESALVQDTPCPLLTLANLQSQGNIAGAQGNSATTTTTTTTYTQGNSAATSTATSTSQGGNAGGPGVVSPPTEVSANALNNALGQVKEDLAVTVLQQNTTTAQGAISCTPVSVKGDATYCISGRVCNGVESNLPGTNCPKRGDVAIASCLSVFTSYSDADNCVAKQDAQCVAIETGVWGCVFPDVPQLPLAEQQVASDDDRTTLESPATKKSFDTEITTIPLTNALSSPVDGAKKTGDLTGYEADIALDKYTGSAATASTFTANPDSAATGLAGVNVAVAVAALVMAVVGVAAVRKRQNDRRRLDRTPNSSIRNLSCMELSTPI